MFKPREQNLYHVYPKMQTSIPNKRDKKHNCLLKDIEVKEPDQAWSTDTTYRRI